MNTVTLVKRESKVKSFIEARLNPRQEVRITRKKSPYDDWYAVFLEECREKK